MTDINLKEKLKAFILDLVISEPKFLPFNIFSQTLDIVRVFVKLDFPMKWPQLVEHIFNSLDSICAHISSINDENIEQLYRFLLLYLEILKEQSERRIPMKRAPFVKQAKIHMEKFFPLWQNITLTKWSEQSPEEFKKSDEAIFEISKLLDK